MTRHTDSASEIQKSCCIVHIVDVVLVHLSFFPDPSSSSATLILYLDMWRPATRQITGTNDGIVFHLFRAARLANNLLQSRWGTAVVLVLPRQRKLLPLN